MSLTHPSPNFGDRRGKRVDLVVLHYTAMPTCAAALERLCDPAAEVSSHYLLDADGTLLSLVEETDRAWHAGAGSWRRLDDVNSRSIGIELANPGDRPFPEPQMSALERLLADILERHALPPQAVIAHSDMAPDRKSDPGQRFDWRRLALQGLSVWPETNIPALPPPHPSPTRGKGGAGALAVAKEAEARFLSDLQAFGYPDAPAAMLLTAFRLRFRPWAAGPLDDIDSVLAAGLRPFAVDAGHPPA